MCSHFRGCLAGLRGLLQVPTWTAECTHQPRKSCTPSLSAGSLASEQHEKRRNQSNQIQTEMLDSVIKVNMCRGKVAFSAAISCGSYNMCFNAVLHFVDGDTGCFRCFGFAQHSAAHDKGDFVAQSMLDAVL